MNEILDLVQQTLDSTLSASQIHSHWGRRGDDKGDEYIIYSWESDIPEVSADGTIYYRTAEISLQYYVKYVKARTYAGRLNTANNMDMILKAMRSAGFGCTGGWSEIGDVDDIGFSTFRAVFEIAHIVEDDNGES